MSWALQPLALDIPQYKLFLGLCESQFLINVQIAELTREHKIKLDPPSTLWKPSLCAQCWFCQRIEVCLLYLVCFSSVYLHTQWCSSLEGEPFSNTELEWFLSGTKQMPKPCLECLFSESSGHRACCTRQAGMCPACWIEFLVLFHERRPVHPQGPC